MNSDGVINEVLEEHGRCKAELTDYKSKYEELRKELEALKASKQSTTEGMPDKAGIRTNDASKTKVDNLEKEIAEHSNALSSLGDRWDYTIELLHNYCNRLDKLEQYSRLYSLLIHGLRNIPTGFEDKGLVFSDWVANEINKLLPNLPEKLTAQHIDVSHPLPTRSATAKSCIIVKFCRRDIRNMLFYNKRELKGSGVSFSEHLTPANLDLYNEAQKVEGAITWTSQCKIFIKVGNGNKKMISCMRDIDILRKQEANTDDSRTSEQNLNHDMPHNTSTIDGLVVDSTSFPLLSNGNNTQSSKRGGTQFNRGRGCGNSTTRGSARGPRGYARRW